MRGRLEQLQDENPRIRGKRFEDPCDARCITHALGRVANAVLIEHVRSPKLQFGEILGQREFSQGEVH